MSSLRKQQVTALLKSLETGDPAAASVIHPQRYIQHHLGAADGLAGFQSLLALPRGLIKVDTRRVFEDGDYVFAHTEYDFFGPRIGFDVFRYEGEQIVEHWDNLQPTPERPNPAGRTLIDGPTEVRDPQATAANKALVRAFVDDVLVNGRIERARDYIDGEHYLQHHPLIGDGASALIGALQALATAGTPVRYTRVHRVLGEGNFVLVASESEADGASVAFYDLFRVENGKIAEHWDTVEPVLPRSEWKNANGKF